MLNDYLIVLVDSEGSRRELASWLIDLYENVLGARHSVAFDMALADATALLPRTDASCCARINYFMRTILICDDGAEVELDDRLAHEMGHFLARDLGLPSSEAEAQLIADFLLTHFSLAQKWEACIPTGSARRGSVNTRAYWAARRKEASS